MTAASELLKRFEIIYPEPEIRCLVRLQCLLKANVKCIRAFHFTAAKHSLLFF